MQLSDLSTAQIAAIIAFIVLIGGVIVYLLQKRRTEKLLQRFGEAE